MLVKKLQECQNQMAHGDSESLVDIQIYSAQTESLIEEQTKSAAFRARAKYCRDFEKNTKFFFALEKAQHDKKTMTRIQREDGQIISKGDDILQEQKLFYEKLYAQDPAIQFKLVNENKNSKLNQYDKNKTE